MVSALEKAYVDQYAQLEEGCPSGLIGVKKYN